MRFFHTLGVYLYGMIIFLMMLFHEKASKWWNGRKHFWKQLPTVPEKKVVWFHCASLGEFDQGIPVMRLLKEKDPSIFLIVTFFSPSGMDHYHKRSHPADWVGYLPLPTPGNARRFIRYFHPESVFFVKYEFWENYLVAARDLGAKTYCIAANFRENHRFFGRFKFLFAPVLFLFDAIFVQNEQSLWLLKQINYKNGILAGDTRIDKVLENKKKVQQDSIVETFLEGEQAIVLGSSWPVDEQLWKNYILTHPSQKFIIAPHDVSEKHIEQISALFPEAQRYTSFNKAASNILIVDCIGKLSNLYQYGKLAYIGGGFTGKLHNILEPAVFGLPVLIGPKHYKFPEARQLIDKGVVFMLSSSEELEALISDVLESREEIAQKAGVFFESNQHAANRIVERILLG